MGGRVAHAAGTEPRQGYGAGRAFVRKAILDGVDPQEAYLRYGKF
jgi:hypothetical protein